MKKIFLFSVITLILSCSSTKEVPAIYPDLFRNKLLKSDFSLNKMFSSNRKKMWIYSFKTLATLSYMNYSRDSIARNQIVAKSIFNIERNYLGDKYYDIADSIGKVLLDNNIPKFNNFLHFNSSLYLDTLSIRYYKIQSKTTYSKQEKDIIRDRILKEHY